MSGAEVKNIKAITKDVCDVNITDDTKNSPLHLLVHRRGDNEKVLKAIKLLLSAGADVNAKDKQGKTPLYLAVKAERSKDIIEALIDGGADLELTYTDAGFGVNGNILLHAVIPKAIVFSNRTYFYGHPFEQFKFKYMDAEITKLLLDKAARIESADGKTPGCSPLLAAALFRRTDLVKHMLKHISIKDVNIDNVLSRSVLGKFKASRDVVKNFPPYGDAGWNISGSTALHLSIFHSDLEMATAFIEAGVSRNIKDDSGKTPLHHAIECDKHDFLELLVEGCVENSEEPKQK